MPGPLQKISAYFNLNRTERRGLIVLCALLLLIIVLNFTLPFFIKNKPGDYGQFEKELEAFLAGQQDAMNSVNQDENGIVTRDSSITGNAELFYFDPNGLSDEKWRALGLSEQQIRVIKNYEASSGHFDKPEDLAKIYSISPEEYKNLEPWIVIRKEPKKPKSFEIPLIPHPFDPNTIGREELTKMGVEEKLANTLIKYRDKGGFFRTPEDFKKLYFVDDNLFDILKPYIRIDKSFALILPDSSAFEDDQIKFTIEINHADTLDLQQLSGIGPSFSRRIVKYREMLGGYYSKEQLLEVYGMDSLRFAGLSGFIEIDPESIEKININEAGIKDLIRHPYIEFYLAKSIITHRNDIGKYNNLEELLNAKLIYKELYEKIKPYLTI